VIGKNVMLFIFFSFRFIFEILRTYLTYFGIFKKNLTYILKVKLEKVV